MANRNIHIVAHDPNGGWNSLRAGSDKIIKHFDRKQDCIDYTRQISKNQGTELRIQNRDGKFGSADSHGNDPHPPKG